MSTRCATICSRSVRLRLCGWSKDFHLIRAIKSVLRRMILPPHAVVLAYHGVLRSPLSFPVWHHLDKDRFEEQMAWLGRNCHCVSLKDLLAGNDRADWHRNTVAVTFDDGFYSTYAVALPILQKYSIPATVFVAAGYIGDGEERQMWPDTVACVLHISTIEEFDFAGRRMHLRGATEKFNTYRLIVRYMKGLSESQRKAELDALMSTAGVVKADLLGDPLVRELRILSRSELKAMAASELIEIGAHTMTHPRLSNLSAQQAAWELAESRRTIEQMIGHVRYFAYPYGGEEDFLLIHKQMAKEAGYEAAFTAAAGCVLKGVDLFAVPRVSVGSSMSLADLEYAVTGGVARMASDGRRVEATA